MGGFSTCSADLTSHFRWESNGQNDKTAGIKTSQPPESAMNAVEWPKKCVYHDPELDGIWLKYVCIYLYIHYYYYYFYYYYFYYYYYFALYCIVLYYTILYHCILYYITLNDIIYNIIIHIYICNIVHIYIFIYQYVYLSM